MLENINSLRRNKFEYFVIYDDVNSQLNDIFNIIDTSGFYLMYSKLNYPLKKPEVSVFGNNITFESIEL